MGNETLDITFNVLTFRGLHKGLVSVSPILEHLCEPAQSRCVLKVSCIPYEACRLLAKSHQSCLNLCNPIGYSSPGSSVHGILQARTLEWVSKLSSRGSSQPRD